MSVLSLVLALLLFFGYKRFRNRKRGSSGANSLYEKQLFSPIRSPDEGRSVGIAGMNIRLAKNQPNAPFSESPGASWMKDDKRRIPATTRKLGVGVNFWMDGNGYRQVKNTKTIQMVQGGWRSLGLRSTCSWSFRLPKSNSNTQPYLYRIFTSRVWKAVSVRKLASKALRCKLQAEWTSGQEECGTFTMTLELS